jgi:bifunctional UDP-N-acetylglucosamine pyrophosphorylase/glucosamine-1-phosphate N-acetyltransferase
VSKDRGRPSRTSHTIPGVILAAGKGTRMKAGEPKAAVPIGGKPMVVRVAEAVRGASISRIIAVVGHRADDVRAALGDGVIYVVQRQQLGTGHAASCSRTVLRSYRGPVIVAYADIPLLPRGEVARLIDRHVETGAAATLLTAVFDEPGTLGRIVRAGDGCVRAIVEARDASDEELRIKEINVGVYCFEVPLLFEVLDEVTEDNAQHQQYLTDAIKILVARGARVEALPLETARTGMGVDTAEDLAEAERYWMVGKAP